MKIQPLPSNVRSYLRSGVAITSVTQCVEELVLNSLDAGATCVAVRLDLNCFKVQVVDNGTGVPNDQLDILGNRFCTSKCHTIEDLNNLCHFGYRGEALASIRDSCGIFEITTQSKLSSKTYCKIFQNGKSLKVAESTIVRPSVGTTITVHELFSNFPVRQKSMNKNLEMERIREMLEGVALIRPGISFTLRNDSTGQMVLSTRKCASVNSTFGQLYGSAKADMLVEVRGSKQLFQVQGYIGREGHQRKNLQLIYINGRIVKKTKVHKLLNKLLLNLPALKPKLRPSSKSPQMLSIKQNLFSSPPKFSEAYPVYVLEFKCPISEYDITFEPTKTMVEFKDWDTVLECVEEVTTSFLDKENIVVKTDEVQSRFYNAITATENKKQEKPVISADNMKDMLSSKLVKKVTNVVKESSDDRNSGEDNSAESLVKIDAFKTPANNAKVSVKGVRGLGNRNIEVETDTDSEIETTTTTDDTPSTDESFDNEIQISVKDKNDRNDADSWTNSKAQVGKSDNKKYCNPTTKCSLSMFRESIGKFTGRPAKKVNIDESLKKLDRIMPSSSKTNSKTLVSSLQKFRRKVEIRNTAAETKINQAEDKKANSFNLGEDNRERSNHMQYRDKSETMPKAFATPDINLSSYNGSNVYENDVQLATTSKEKQGTINTSINTECSKVYSLDLDENKTSNSAEDKQFKFSLCYNNIRDEYGHIDDQKFNTSANNTEDKPNGEVSLLYTDIEGPERKGSIIDMGELHSAQCHSLYVEKSDQRLDGIPDNDFRNAIFERKRSCLDSDLSPVPEKQFRYTARPLALEELRMDVTFNKANCDRYGNMCNKTDCDKIDINYEDIETSENFNPVNICDHVNRVCTGNNSPCIRTDSVRHVPEKQVCIEGMNENKIEKGPDEAEHNDVLISANNEVEKNEMHVDTFIASTQAFSPRMSPQVETVDVSLEENYIIENSKTPESMGFSPKLIIEASTTPCSTGFDPSESIEGNVEQSIRNDKEKEEINGKDCTNESGKDIELKIEIETNKYDEGDKVLEEKAMLTSTEDKIISFAYSESITLTQLFRTPQKTESVSTEQSADTDTLGTGTESTEVKMKGFSFDDLFSQTPTCSSVNVDTGIDSGKVDYDKEVKNDQFSNACSDCSTVTTNKSLSSNSRCAEIDSNMDVGFVGRKNETEPSFVEETEEKESDNLWGDSPWDISDSSFYLRDEIKLNENDESEDKELESDGTDGHEENKDSTKVDREDSVKAVDESTFLDDQNLRTMDSLNAWYNNLDAGTTGTSNILQSNKPSDVVRKLHACRFSKKSLKSVKVLGQLDKKFIACLINTEQQGSNTDMTMLVLIDQHAAHERIRLEILTEDAFEEGVKGGQLAPFVVNPPQTMTFAEHEIRTILAFLDGYQKLGIRMKKDSATSMLLTSVPASLVNREKNNKIYWSTIQVLIREYIAVFMSTQVSCGVLPQTIHKVLCSLACHGAIKFGDKLATDECEKLIKDLSRCDLPFQCAHGRPSVTPLFHIDKLQSLSHSKVQAKPKLWKLTQALKMKSK
ncbi:uncharacterized protein LOC132748671 [Ruditapes philippinarum]|uniref:uncharacterized protein LOC132748671 n=1 Tax=Ruditapes philippinarum TaxID=129788 RepID=UPI00295BA178|nr:uncharacterized protein LOC132748671 [Ruditapes philippinarum]